MPLYSLTRSERLQSADYRHIYKEGYSYRGSNLILRKVPNGLSVNRLGISFVKGTLNNAPTRNYARRIIKEAYRLSKPHKIKGFNIVVTLLKKDQRYADVKKGLDSLLMKAGIL